MGLDIYTGTLTRYYSKNWKSVIEQYAEENNMEFERINSNDVAQEEIDIEEVKEICIDWRNNIISAIKEHIENPTIWTEDNEKEYYTDKPNWDCYGALIMFALFSEQSTIPPKEYDENWGESEVYTKASSEDYETSYQQLVKGCEIWLPLNFNFIFNYNDPSENEIAIGSIYALLQNLDKLNAKIWNASKDSIELWAKEIDPASNIYEDKAKFGFSILYTITEFAIRNQTPIKLDY
ncbi:MAG: hypothetical protein V4565_05400 [Bacteroidota bacterium]